MSSKYTAERIAWELEQTALNAGHWGNALRVAKDLATVTSTERSLLDRFATGAQTSTDHIQLQQLANKLRSTQ